MIHKYYDIDFDDSMELNHLFLLYNMVKAGILGRIRFSCNGKNLHAEREKEYSFPLHDVNYDTLSEWKGVSTCTVKLYQYVWRGKEVKTLVGEASDWFSLDETELFHMMNELMG